MMVQAIPTISESITCAKARTISPDSRPNMRVTKEPTTSSRIA